MEWYVVARGRGAGMTSLCPEKNRTQRLRLRLAIGLFAALLAILGVAGYTWAQKRVFLTVDGKTLAVATFQMDVAGLLKQSGVKLGPEDTVVPEPKTRLCEGMQVKVVRALPVTVTVDGTTRRYFTRGKTVADLLREEGIRLGKEDIVSPALGTQLRADAAVRITRVTRTVQEKEVTLPYKVRRKPTASLLKGQTRVLVAGRSGLALEQWEVVLHDGKEKTRRLLARRVVRPPVDRVVAVGILQTISRGGEELRFTQVFTMCATAYTYTGRNTACGISPRPGVVAVDPTLIPFGTRLYVEGYGHALACDRGSSIRGNRIDVFFPSWAEARAWGVRYVRVYVLE
uniref:DUF348 domain-containing protein n=1 Tax=Ammonifex degensii TaxID=42838 RepID=A0A7C1IXW4_9THEO